MTSTSETAIDTLRQQALNHLKNLYKLDEQVAGTLLTKASNTLTESVQSLRMAAEENDLEKTKFQAHALKGAVLNLGLEELATQAKRIEHSTTIDKTVINTFLKTLDDSGLL